MPVNRTTKGGYSIASHLGMDGDSFEDDYRYQSTRWTRPVYAIDDAYWCAGPKPAAPIQGGLNLKWTRLVSSYDKATVLWRATESEDE